MRRRSKCYEAVKKAKQFHPDIVIMAEAAKVLHTNKEFSYKVLAKYLGIGNTKILDAAYGAEIKVLERRLEIRPEGLQAILDDVVKTEPRAKNIKQIGRAHV